MSRTSLNGCNFEGTRFLNVNFGIHKPDLMGHEERVNSVVIRYDSKFIVSGSENNIIHIWDYATGK